MVMRLPEKKPVPTACSSWTSPELGLSRYLDGPKTVVLAAKCRGQSRKVSTSPSSIYVVVVLQCMIRDKSDTITEML